VLEKQKFVWPSMREMLHVGSKIAPLMHLHRIALEMEEPCLSLQVLDEFPVHFSEHLFVKRGYSDCSTHAVHLQTTEKQKEFQELWNKTKCLYRQLPQTLQPQWFSMPYVESLQVFGEMRCYMIGGVFSHINRTIVDPEIGSMEVIAVDEVTPLEDIG
jgi:hypothetical protein